MHAFNPFQRDGFMTVNGNYGELVAANQKVKILKRMQGQTRIILLVSVA